MQIRSYTSQNANEVNYSYCISYIHSLFPLKNVQINKFTQGVVRMRLFNGLWSFIEVEE